MKRPDIHCPFRRGLASRLLGVLLLALSSCAEDGAVEPGQDSGYDIAGTVSSPQRGPLAGVRVQASPSGRSAVTNDEGRYRITGVRGAAGVTLEQLPPGCDRPLARQVAPVEVETEENHVVDCDIIPVARRLLDGPCRINPNGTASCYGYLPGDGSTFGPPFFVQIAPAVSDSLIDVSAWSGQLRCVLSFRGQAFCWGDNLRGGVGNGAFGGEVGGRDVATPAPVVQSAGVTFVQVAVGTLHACGLTPRGRVYCWGSNFYGSLGDGTTQDRSIPAPVIQPDSLRFVQVVANYNVTCGLTALGDAHCWGNGEEVGAGSTAPRLTPTAVAQPGNVRFRRLTRGCGITVAGRVYCWGGVYQRTDSTRIGTLALTPVEYLMPTGMAVTDFDHDLRCAITESQRVVCWGSNFRSMLGDTTVVGWRSEPRSPMRLENAEAISVAGKSEDGACALIRGIAGVSTVCWGTFYFPALPFPY